MAVSGSSQAAQVQLATGLPVMAMGGFTGSDDVPTLEQLQAYVASGQLRYVLLSGSGAGSGARGGASTGSVSAWEAWFKKLGGAVVDPGNPCSTARTIAADGSVGALGPSAISGYTILSADSLDQAVGLARSCPVLGGGASIEVCETFDAM